MPRAGGACAVVLAVAVAGCLDPTGPRVDALRPPPPPAGLPPAMPDGLYVESVLLERPLGDPVLDRELWAGGSAVPPHVRALLAENGLRATVLGGTPPRAFQRLLESSDAHPGRGQSFANRRDDVIPTAGPTDPCSFAALPNLAGGRTRFDLRHARGGVRVRPDRTPDGRVSLRCEPQVQHGEREDHIRPTADGTTFTVQGEVPLERFPSLGFDVALGPDDYLLIGSPASAADTLGAALFTADANGRPRQRVLVVRAAWRGERPSDLPPVRGRPAGKR